MFQMRQRFRRRTRQSAENCRGGGLSSRPFSTGGLQPAGGLRQAAGGMGRSESARAIRWTRLRPASAKSTLPHLRILPDDWSSSAATKARATAIRFCSTACRMRSRRCGWRRLGRVAAQTWSRPRFLRRSVWRLRAERIHRDGRWGSRPLQGGRPIVRVKSRRSGSGDRRQPADLMDSERRTGERPTPPSSFRINRCAM